MVVKTKKPASVHLVATSVAQGPESRDSKTLCGTALPPKRVEVVMPWDDPTACQACVDVRKTQLEVATVVPLDQRAPTPNLFQP